MHNVSAIRPSCRTHIWPQFSLSKEWRVDESFRFNLGNFGRVGTNTRGGFSDIGTGSPNHLLVFRLEW